jgi:MOSC domain-containing protein YiiM
MRVTAEAAAASLEPYDAVHATEHAFVDAGRALAALGVPERQAGSVVGLFASGGGVPKSAIDEAVIGRRGVAGDRQATRRHHGRVSQALCLWSVEVLDALRAEGHPIEPGSAGENVLVAGVDWASLRPGVRLRIGTALAEVSGWALPCTKNAPWFADGDFRRIDPDLRPGSSRAYATVVEDGVARVGDGVVVEPEASSGG